MTRLPELQRALVAAAAELEVADAPRVRARARVRRRRRSTARVLAVAMLVVLALAAIAVAATSLLQRGSDVQPRSGRPPTPKRALGVATGAVAAPITAPDTKDDNLPWGLRTFKTTRGYACVQVGRMQDGELGLVGRDGAFQDDGKFHVLGPQVLEEVNCTPVDGAGHGYLVLHYAAYPASGYVAGCIDPWWVAQGFADKTGRHKACPARDERALDFGLLGPHATSVTYRLPSGEQRTVKTQPGTGAFLVVTPHQTEQPLAPGERPMPHSIPSQEFVLSRTPSALTIVAVGYDDGTTCRVRHERLGIHGSAGGCPAVGYVPVHVRQPTHAEVATKMKLSITREADGRHRDLHVRFRARVAATGSRAAYYLFLHPPRPHGCGSMGEGHTIEQDVRAGQRVGAKVRLLNGGCAGTWKVELSYRVAVEHPSAAGVTNLHYPGTIVDRGTVTTD
jgi:hypothetical protein